jgi:hypothetical protein
MTDEIIEAEKFHDKVIQILKESHDSDSGIDYVIKHLQEDLKMTLLHLSDEDRAYDDTQLFLSEETEIIVVLDSIDGYHIYQKEKQGQW